MGSVKHKFKEFDRVVPNTPSSVLCFTFFEVASDRSSGDHLSSKYSLNLRGSAMDTANTVSTSSVAHEQTLLLKHRKVLYVLNLKQASLKHLTLSIIWH